MNIAELDEKYISDNEVQEVDGYKWIWNGLWRLENHKLYEIVEMSSSWMLNTDDLNFHANGSLEDLFELGVKMFIEWQKKKRNSIFNRLGDMMEIARELKNERYTEILDFILTDLVNNREGGLTKNEIILLNEISEKMAMS